MYLSPTTSLSNSQYPSTQSSNQDPIPKQTQKNLHRGLLYIQIQHLLENSFYPIKEKMVNQISNRNKGGDVTPPNPDTQNHMEV